MKRLQNKIAIWVINAVEEYIAEHGQDMLEKVLEWARSQIVNGDAETFASAPPIPGCEEFCEKQTAKLKAITEEE